MFQKSINYRPTHPPTQSTNQPTNQPHWFGALGFKYLLGCMMRESQVWQGLMKGRKERGLSNNKIGNKFSHIILE